MAEQQKRNPHDLQAHAVGTLASISLETTKPKEGSNKLPTQYVKAEISACGSRLRVTVFGSKKKPNLPQELMAQLGVGQKVSARGSLEEQVGQDQHLYRGLRAWGIGPADAHEEEKLVYFISGNMGRLERTAAGEYVVPIICIQPYEKDGVPVEQEKPLRVSPSEDMLKLLYEKVTVGRTIRARGDIIAKMNLDKYGLPMQDQPFISRLTVALLEVWDQQVETWTSLASLAKPGGGTGPAPAPQPGPASAPAPTPTQPGFHDDNDVPF